MSKLALPGGRPGGRRQPLVVLSLLLNILLLGASVLWWSGSGTVGVLQGTSLQATRRELPRAAGFEACERAHIDEQKMEEWGCKVLEKVCFDQESVLLHSGEKTPNSPNFTHDAPFTVVPVPSYVLPGFEEPLGTPH